MIYKFAFNRAGFTLIEVLVSIFIVGGILTIMYSGFDLSNIMQSHANYESEASLLAEREMEFIKSELICGNIKYTSKPLLTHFKLDEGWKLSTNLIKTDESDVKIIVNISKDKQKLELVSYVYIPGAEENKNHEK